MLFPIFTQDLFVSVILVALAGGIIRQCCLAASAKSSFHELSVPGQVTLSTITSLTRVFTIPQSQVSRGCLQFHNHKSHEGVYNSTITITSLMSLTRVLQFHNHKSHEGVYNSTITSLMSLTRVFTQPILAPLYRPILSADPLGN